MNDPWNPTSAEVREWAYTADATAPCEDWMLALDWAEYVPLYVEFASDPRCPNRGYFLNVLYFMVGNAVRTDFRNHPEPVVHGWLKLAPGTRIPDLALWAQRARALLRTPESFKYEEWCNGGFGPAP